jgi:hypothetical protein
MTPRSILDCVVVHILGFASLRILTLYHVLVLLHHLILLVHIHSVISFSPSDCFLCCFSHITNPVNAWFWPVEPYKLLTSTLGTPVD